MNRAELIIQNGSTIYYPVIEEGITWETARMDTPGKLNFSIVLDDNLKNFQEGNPVRFKWDDKKVFYGFVFIKKRNKDGTIKVTAYDQLRYFKNKDTYVITNKTASGFIMMLASDFNLKVGVIEDTGFIIPSLVEDNKSLFDMVKDSLDLTLKNKKKLYVLYDDFGELTLKDIESMKLNFLIDKETAEDFDYSTSIDGETYNKIKLSYENDDSGKRDIYIAQDSSNINNWGVLQYYEKIKEPANGKAKADTMLSMYNKKARSLTISNVLGDVRVRGGCNVPVALNLGDIVAKNYMVVESVKHTFNDNEHLMNLTMKGW